MEVRVDGDETIDGVAEQFGEDARGHHFTWLKPRVLAHVGEIG